MPDDRHAPHPHDADGLLGDPGRRRGARGAAVAARDARVWLSHLYEVPAAAVRDMSGQQVLRELRARSLTGRRANLVAEMQWRQDKLFDLNGPARTNFGRSVWSDRPRNSYELVAKCPAAWSKKRKEAALALARNAKYHDDGGGGGAIVTVTVMVTVTLTTTGPPQSSCPGLVGAYEGPYPRGAPRRRPHRRVAPRLPGGLGVRVLPGFAPAADVDGLRGVRHAHVPKQHARR